MFDRVGWTGIANAMSICKLWSAFCPKTNSHWFSFMKNKFVLIANHYLPNFQGIIYRSWNVSDKGVDGHYLRTYLFSFWSKSDFVPHMAYGTKAIIWHLSIDWKFFWVNRKSIFIGRVSSINYHTKIKSVCASSCHLSWYFSIATSTTSS